MFTTSAALVALSAFTLVSAQANSNSTFTIDPTTVDISDRVAWCQGETDSCSTLCGTAIDNSCSTDTLDFQCTCQGGNSPNMNLYENTMPWVRYISLASSLVLIFKYRSLFLPLAQFVCERLQQNCIVQFENDAAGQKNCTSTYGDKCGTEQVEDHAGQGATGGTSSSSSASASGSATAAASNSAAASTSSSQAAAVPTNVQYLGNESITESSSEPTEKEKQLPPRADRTDLFTPPLNPPQLKMASSSQFTVPVGTRYSIGIELEFLVAWLKPGEKDPYESDADSLPPLLRIDSITKWNAEVQISKAIRSTLREHGIDVVGTSNEDSSGADPPPTIEHPFRLRDKDKWSVGSDASVSERLNDDYNWGAVELRSPALWAKPESFKEIEFVVNVLTSSHRVRINPTCGFHVHVGNGKWFFPAGHIKRLGSFFWAADPMISRLHPAWRRVAGYSRSIRYDSSLAKGATAKSVEEGEQYKRWINELDPIPVTDFSDTTREEKEFGTQKKWEEFARWRNEVGPFMTLGGDDDDIGNSADNNDDNDGGDGNDGGSDGDNDDGGDDYLPLNDFLSPISEPEFSLPSHAEMLEEGRQLLEEDRKVNVPRDQDTLHRNVGFVHWDELHPEASEWIRGYCEGKYGHRNVEQLPTTEQLSCMLLTQCILLFGHMDLTALTKDQEYQVLVASSPYIEAARSRYDWNPTTEKWERNWQRFGYILEHTSAEREIKIDAPYIVQKFENMAKLMELDGEHSKVGIEYTSREEHDKATQTNKGIEQLLESLKDYVESPGPHYLENLADPFDTLYEVLGLEPPTRQSGEDEATGAENPAEENNEPVSSPAAPSSSDKSAASSAGSFHPPAWDAARSEPGDNSPGHPTGNNSDGFPPIQPQTGKLLPHDISTLSVEYKRLLRRYTAIDEDNWEEIGYLPYTTNALAGPAASYAFKEPPINGDAKVTTVKGIAEIASASSAMVAAELLVPSREHIRLNYNFAFYRLAHMRSADGMGPYSTNYRTIEFREAAATLDAQWIEIWARICVGMLSWACRASVHGFMVVIGRIMAQEERELRRLAAAGASYLAQAQDEADRYDVCDMLEDLGLFTEAAWIRKRERIKGPPT
ncbi:putative amidoligase enzyme-domain-containing protein [Hypoxylon sp. FL0890]|nr:putative amidoligase enzyme-domain-containing protein [Hypoxylon sp. FL0890]